MYRASLSSQREHTLRLGAAISQTSTITGISEQPTLRRYDLDGVVAPVAALQIAVGHLPRTIAQTPPRAAGRQLEAGVEVNSTALFRSFKAINPRAFR